MLFCQHLESGPVECRYCTGKKPIYILFFDKIAVIVFVGLDKIFIYVLVKPIQFNSQLIVRVRYAIRFVLQEEILHWSGLPENKPP